MPDFNENPVPNCPGCHFGCPLDSPRCGRGFMFQRKWQAGEEIPQRGRGPMMGGPKGGPQGGPGKPGGPQGGPGRPGMPGMDDDMMLYMILSTMLPRMISRDNGGDAEKILEWIIRQEGCMEVTLVPERCGVSEDSARYEVGLLIGWGFLRPERDEAGRTILYATDEGRAWSEQCTAKHKENIKERFSALTEDEKKQLRTLLDKLARR